MSFSCHFISFKKSYLQKKEEGYIIVLKSFWVSIPYSLYSFQILTNVSTIHQQYFHISSSKNFNINLSNHLPQWKLNNGSISQWLFIFCLHPQA